MTRIQPEPSLADDHSAREQALDPAESFIVQAPAGSGKTELLVQRVLRLLATVEKPTEVLAITFTKKAAGEMRARVLNALLEARQSDEPESSPARERWQLARKVLHRDRECGWRIAERPALLNIDTFDAFSLRIAKLAPLEAGAPNPALYALEEDASANYREAARRALLDPDNLASSETAEAAERLLVALDNRVESVIESIAALLSKRALWIDRFVDDSDEAIARFRETIQASVGRELHALAVLWPSTETARVCSLAAYAESQVIDSSKRNLLQRLASATLTRDSLDSLDEWSSLAEFVLTGGGEWRKKVDVRDGFPSDGERGLDAELKRERREAKAAMLGLLTALRDADERGVLSARLLRARNLPDLDAIARQEAILRAALRLVKIAAAELQLIERARATTDFSGIAIGAKLALNNHREEIFSRLDSKISHILVDEFQDTNPSQLSLLEALVDPWSVGDGHTLFIVGDPMQSIYAFRDADVSIFTDVWSHGLRNVALTPLKLCANYRSQPAIVRWVNESLESVFDAPPTRLDLPAVRFARALATRAEKGGGKTTPCVNGISEYPDSETEADAIASEICRLQRDSLQSRIAIIVRARQHADAIMRALEARQIAFTAQEMSPWTERSLIRDLISLTYVLAQPDDRLSWYSWLRSPMVGLTLESLTLIAEHAPPSFFLQATQEAALLGRLAHGDRQRLACALTAVSRSLSAANLFSLSNRVFGVFLDCVGDELAPTPELKDEVEAYLSFLDEVCDDGFLPPRALLEARIAKSHQSFTFSPREAAEPGTAYVKPASVEILTIHKSKGLEWDYVFLPQLNRGTPADKRQLIAWSFIRSAPIKQARAIESYPVKRVSLRPAAQLLVAAKDARRKLHRSVFDFVNERGNALREEESKRLLYVAVTRAREGLWISSSARSTEAGYPRGSLARLLARMDAALDAATESPENAAQTNEVGSKRLHMRGSLVRIPLDRVPHRDGAALVPPRVKIASTNELDSTIPSSFYASEDVSEARAHQAEIALGIVGHKLIEGLSRAHLAGASFEFHERFVKRALVECGCPVSQLEQLISILRTSLSRMATSPHFAFIHSPEHRDSADEAPLAATSPKQVHAAKPIEVFRVDRTFLTKEGVRWIVDYKFSVRVDVEPHRAQMHGYVSLFKALEPDREVKAALYFPQHDELIVL